MGHSQLLLQIVTLDGRRIRFGAGNVGDTLERDLTAACVESVTTAVANGLAAELSSASLLTRMRGRFTPAALDPIIRKVTQAAVAHALNEAILSLKHDSRFIWGNPATVFEPAPVEAPLAIPALSPPPPDAP